MVTRVIKGLCAIPVRGLSHSGFTISYHSVPAGDGMWKVGSVHYRVYKLDGLVPCATPRCSQTASVAITRPRWSHAVPLCLKHAGADFDYDSMDLLLDALEDPSPQVRARAAVFVRKMLGRSFPLGSNDSDQRRKQMIKGMRAEWERLKGSSGLEDFKQRLKQQNP